MEEETDIATMQAQEATASETTEATNELAGKDTSAIKDESGDSQEKATTQAPNLEEEVEFEAGGKTFKRKLGDIVKLFESDEALSKREKAFLEREKSLNRDYTQKSSVNANFRKEVETTFGRFPEREELKALGKLWNSYFKDPQAKQLIDQVLTGQFQVGNGQDRSKVDPYVQQLEQKIAQLEERQNGFVSSFEERQNQTTQAENLRIWSTWTKAQESKGIKITEEVDREMAPFVRAIRQARPDLEPGQVLNEAYKHATIDQLKQTTAKETLVSADKAKKQGMIRITPKGGTSSDTNKSYKEIFAEAQA
jgi:hypothetical protein